MAKDKGFEPIEIALAYVLNQDFPVFPLIGPRNLLETESSVNSLKVKLTMEEMKWLDLNLFKLKLYYKCLLNLYLSL